MAERGTVITFSDEQAMLLDTATTFCREHSPPAAVRRLLASETGFDAGTWQQMVQLGWPGITVPERFGGSGLTLADAATLAEPMGRHLLATPFASTQLFVQAALAATGTVQAACLPRIRAGEVGTVALFEADGDFDFTHGTTTATAGATANNTASDTASGQTLTLHGRKTLVVDGGVADWFAISLLHAGAPALLVVRGADVPAARRRREVVIDETRRSYALDLDGLRVPAAGLVTGAAAARALARIRDAALLLASAEAAGGAAGVLAIVVDYLNTRTAFGRRIGSFQALKHTCADILVGLERARSHVYHAASLLAAGADPEVAVRMAKVEAGETFALAGDRAIQFHGGFGFTYECDAQLYLRRALWLQYAYGDAAHHRRRLADLLLPA
jgi:alkylation response protein AidB-like acyl-CoA dehydrogenase